MSDSNTSTKGDNKSVELKTIDDIDLKSQVQEVVPKSVIKDEDFDIGMDEQKGANLLEQLRGLRS